MDTVTQAVRSRVMGAVRGKGNRSTELRMIMLFRAWKITGWRRGVQIFGRPDFVFQREHVAVFVDGDFWHGHPRRCRMPKTNVEFWSAKISANRLRDRRVNAVLRAGGWSVVRVWESALSEHPTSVAHRLLSTLGRNRIR